MEIEKVMEEERKEKDEGEKRYWMGEDWRRKKDREMKEIKNMIERVKEMGMEKWMKMGMMDREKEEKIEDEGIDY